MTVARFNVFHWGIELQGDGIHHTVAEMSAFAGLENRAVRMESGKANFPGSKVLIDYIFARICLLCIQFFLRPAIGFVSRIECPADV